MVNEVTLIGRLGGDPEVRFLQDGKAVANFSMVTSESWTDKSGEKQEKAEWHKIVVWGKTAENCGKYIGKGSQVYVRGTIRNKTWEDADGNKKYSVEIEAREVKFLTFKSDDTAEGSTEKPTSSQKVDDTPMSFNDDDIPF
jgi:single-strand DNA-binding protein